MSKIVIYKISANLILCTVLTLQDVTYYRFVMSKARKFDLVASKLAMAERSKQTQLSLGWSSHTCLSSYSVHRLSSGLQVTEMYLRILKSMKIFFSHRNPRFIS